jgi:hypothetical protein
MDEGHATIHVLTLRAMELVQKGYALAIRTDNSELKDACVSLESALIPKDLKKGRVRIRAEHSKHIELINAALSAQE